MFICAYTYQAWIIYNIYDGSSWGGWAKISDTTKIGNQYCSISAVYMPKLDEIWLYHMSNKAGWDIFEVIFDGASQTWANQTIHRATPPTTIFRGASVIRVDGDPNDLVYLSYIKTSTLDIHVDKYDGASWGLDQYTDTTKTWMATVPYQGVCSGGTSTICIMGEEEAGVNKELYFTSDVDSVDCGEAPEEPIVSVGNMVPLMKTLDLI